MSLEDLGRRAFLRMATRERIEAALSDIEADSDEISYLTNVYMDTIEACNANAESYPTWGNGEEQRWHLIAAGDIRVQCDDGLYAGPSGWIDALGIVSGEIGEL